MKVQFFRNLLRIQFGELTGFYPLAIIGCFFSKSPRKGCLLNKAFYLITGVIFLAGCGGLSMRLNEPTSSLPHSQLFQASFVSLQDNFEIKKLDSLSKISEPMLQAKMDNWENSRLVLLETGSGKGFSPLPVPQDQELIQSHGLDAEPVFQSPPEGMPTLEIPPPSAEEKKPLEWGKTARVDNTVSSIETHQESPSEKPSAGNPMEALIPSSYDAFGEVGIPLWEPLVFSEEAGPEASAGSKKPSITIANTFPSLVHERVGEFIVFFQTRSEAFFSRALGRSQAYADMMKKILREKNLPEELFYLGLIESGYNPKAFSRARASGIWQFLTKTGKLYGLKVDKWVDERRDPEKSTYAAAEHLKDLYEMFNNWDLVAASYNAGAGKVLRAMQKAKSQDFWEISRHRYLRQETKKYVPMFLAAVTIASEPDKYGFSNVDYHPPLVYEKVVVPPGTSLDWIAKAAETDLSEIRALNPALKRGKTPPNYPHFKINLPPGKKETFEKNFLLFAEKKGSRAAKHSVRRGETLSRIAKRYQVNLQDLCQLNNLSPLARLKSGTIISLPR
jgi:membrane-bound lytic murein transglycosylase D